MEDENASFWLPSYFLTDNDDKLHLKKTTINNNNNKFSYDLFSDNDENSLDDDTSFLSHLTNNLARTSLLDSERPWVYSTSPQSTLTGFGYSRNGSPNGPSQVPSPPLTPELKNDAAWDLLYEAAGQVARLKMNAIAAQMNTRSLLGVPRHSNTNLYNKQYQEIKWPQQNKYCNHHRNNHQQRLPQSAWPPLTTRQQQQRQARCGSHVRVGPTMGEVKRQSVGTGVFIPRKVSTSPPRHRHHHYEAQYNTEFCRMPTEIMMERRNAILGEQRMNNNLTRTMNINNNNKTATMGHAHGHTREIRLPTDWTY